MRRTWLRVTQGLFAVFVGTTSTLLTLFLIAALFAPPQLRAMTDAERLEHLLVEGMYADDTDVRDRHIAASVLLRPDSEQVRWMLEELAADSPCARRALASLEAGVTCASALDR